MKAELKDGTIIQLHKDCGCLDEFHSEHVPHWVHMDVLDRKLNQKHLEKEPKTFLAGQAFLQEEIRRLNDKKSNFSRYGIVRLIPEEGDKL